MASWIWLVIGIGLIALELFLPTGFYLFILGVSGIVVGLLVSTGSLESWMLQALAFCAIAIAMSLVIGEKLRRVFGSKSAEPGQVIGKAVHISSDIQPGHIGSGELWGTTWRLENVDSVALHVGDEGTVVSAEGITLRVRRK